MATITDPALAVEPWTWQAAVAQASAVAHAKLPESLHGDLERATSLVLQGAVFFEDDGATCQVRSGTDATQFYPVNGHCACARAQQAHKGLCKHRLSALLYLRADELFRAGPPQPEQVLGSGAPDNDDLPDAADLVASQKIPKEYLQLIHGKLFIRYIGLLAMAHAQGLTSLSAKFVGPVTETLAVAEAQAVFADGRVFWESADATPKNVDEQVRPHFARVALTRSKARALRDALGIGLVSVEELE